MYTREKMEQRNNEELRVIALQKDKKGIATKEAYIAQVIIWERKHYPSESHWDDEYELNDMERNFMSYWTDNLYW